MCICKLSNTNLRLDYHWTDKRKHERSHRELVGAPKYAQEPTGDLSVPWHFHCYSWGCKRILSLLVASSMLSYSCTGNASYPEHWHHQTLVRMWSDGNSHLLLVGVKNGAAPGKHWPFLTKLNILLPFNPASTPWHLTKGSENLRSHDNLHVDVYSSLFINAKIWKQPECPPAGEWINDLWYNQTMECFSALKRNELLNHEKIWKKLKCISLSLKSQSEKANSVGVQL